MFDSGKLDKRRIQAGFGMFLLILQFRLATYLRLFIWLSDASVQWKVENGKFAAIKGSNCCSSDAFSRASNMAFADQEELMIQVKQS